MPKFCVPPVLLPALIACCFIFSDPPNNNLLAEIPIETASGGVPFFSVTLNSSTPLQVLLDSSRASCLVDREIAGKLRWRLPPGGALPPDKRTDARTAPETVVQAGRAEYRGSLLAAPLAPFEPFYGRPLEGALGGDWIRQYVVELDIAKKLIRLYTPSGFRYEGKAKPVPLSVFHEIPYVEMDLILPNGKSLWGSFQLDTGSGMAVSVYKKLADGGRLLEGLRTASATSGGLATESKQIYARASALTIGRFRLARPPVAVTEDASGLHANPAAVGLVGMEVLRRFRVTLDYSRDRMYLEPNEDSRQPFIFDATGLKLHAGRPNFSPPFVYAVEDASPAQAAGIKPGDILLRMDGRETSGLTLEAIRESLRLPGQTHRLTLLRSGKNMEVVLRTREMLP